MNTQTRNAAHDEAHEFSLTNAKSFAIGHSMGMDGEAQLEDEVYAASVEMANNKDTDNDALVLFFDAMADVRAGRTKAAEGDCGEGEAQAREADERAWGHWVDYQATKAK